MKTSQRMQLSCRGVSLRRLIAGVAALGLCLSTPYDTSGADSAWTNNVGTGDWNTSVNNWSAGIPGAGDSAFITNAITTSRNITNGLFGTITVANLVISNNTAFTHRFILNSNQTFIVTGTQTLGSNAILQLYAANNSPAAPAPGTTNLVNNLTMLSNASIVFRRTGGAGFDALIITGQFANTAGNSIISGNGGWSILLSNNVEFVNAGTLNGGRMAGLNPSITVAAGSATNAFRNASTGYFIVGRGTGGNDGGTPHTFTFNSLLINQGTMIFSNNTTSTSGTSSVNIVSQTGQAVTNDTTGTMVLVGTGGTRGDLHVQVAEGGFVNRGTLTSLLEPTVGVRTNSITLQGAGQAFSNAAGGQIILDAKNVNGALAIRADRIINLGTTTLNAGTLVLQTSTGGANTFTNAGTVLFGGGTLVVSNFFNAADGVITGNGTLRTTNTFSAGLLAPGVTTGALTNQGNFTMLGESVSSFEIATNAFGAGVGWDYLFVGGTLTLTGRLDVTLLNGFIPDASDSFLIISNSATIFGSAYSFTNVTTQLGQPVVTAYSNGVAVGTFQVGVAGQSVLLNGFTLVVIPEPATVVLLSIGLLGLGWLGRSKRVPKSAHEKQPENPSR